MCTRVLWPDANGSVIVGRNMDFHFDLLTNLWKSPRGVERTDGVDGNLKWKAKYGSLVATAFDLVATDGMNEEGLAGHILWLAESDYGNPEAGEVQLSQAIWLQYYLDNFKTVAEAVRWTNKTKVEIKQLFDPTGHLVPALHLALDDASGDSAIIEYIDGKPKVYHSKKHKVMTNSPTYDKQLEMVKEVTGLGGDKPIPGSTLASDRFARASYYLEAQPQPKSQLQGMAAMFSIMRNTAQPFRKPDPGKPDASQTLWSAVLDLTNKRYAFESTTRPNIVWVELDQLDFSEGSETLKLDLMGRLSLEGGMAGEVSDQFEKVDEVVTFTLDKGVEVMELIANKRNELQSVMKLLKALA